MGTGQSRLRSVSELESGRRTKKLRVSPSFSLHLDASEEDWVTNCQINDLLLVNLAASLTK